MKYLDSINLIALNTMLNKVDCGDSILSGTLESYSCKVAGSDKKLYKSLDKELEMQYSSSLDHHQHGSSSHLHPKNSSSNNSMSPHSYDSHGGHSSSHSHGQMSQSPFGPLTNSTSRKTMIHLISTLNACFIDYDFSNSKPEQFRKEPNLSMVMNSINTILGNIMPNYQTEVQEKLWIAIDSEIELQKSDVYSFIPESGDPFTEDGVIWSFNYFFYNKVLKRITFFSCRLLNKALQISKDNNLDMDDDDEDLFEYDEYQSEATTSMEF
ncbi:repressor of RNA polymerase III transcription [Cavenderia fasciculata]|uniref:Repressor of RNA polymerase III transcription n=1 Tax=Cavenderia fasciculata TaxID=261658 RepID=F4PPF9_CACFS|nr:repressor of RNA polymerase III transcription [Cavenderia fasciculata]EGG22272.1 repressor of RNA polymerase III transcription [Cavenderia fasciculata]|eukprot:XP_004360123.1 repressor of RNA polymerase III transcription [Cavenderia fasciculata]